MVVGGLDGGWGERRRWGECDYEKDLALGGWAKGKKAGPYGVDWVGGAWGGV